MRSVTCCIDFQGRGAWPQCLHHHGLDGEWRVFLAAEFAILKSAGERDDQHEVDDKALVLQRPAGEVEGSSLADTPDSSCFSDDGPSARPQRVDAGRDNDVPLREPVGDDDAYRSHSERR